MARTAGAAVSAIGGSVAVGLMPAVTSPLATLALCATGLLVLAVFALRRALASALRQGRNENRDAEGAIEPSPQVERPELRLARALFYLGVVTIGDSVFRPALGLTLSELLFISSFLVSAFAALRMQGLGTLPSPVLISASVFAFGGAISSLDAQSPPSSAFEVLHAIYVLVLWPWTGAMVLRTRRQLLTATALWGVSAAIDGLAAIAQVFGIKVLGIAREGNRMTGLTNHPNDLGGVTSIALVPALLFATGQIGNVRSAAPAVVRWGTLALVAVGLVLSGSITGMAAAALALLVWLTSPSVRRSWRVAVVAAGICAMVVVAAAGQRVISPTQRLAQVTGAASEGASGSGQDRISVAQAAWPRILSNPVVGTGLDTQDTGVIIISHGLSVPYQVHGLPLAASYETGIFGVGGLFALLIALAVLGWRSVQRSRADQDLLVSWGLLAAFAAFLVEAMTQPMVFQQYGWIVPVMIVAWVQRAEAREPFSLRSRDSDGHLMPTGHGASPLGSPVSPVGRFVTG